MVTAELIDYIKLQRQQGKSDDLIRKELIANKWLESDINQALQINNSTPSTQSPTSSQVTDSPRPSAGEKPKIIKIISALLFLIACLFLISTISMLGIMLIMDSLLSEGDLVFSFLKHFPTWGFLPIIYSLATLVFFYIAFKIRNGSKISLWSAIATLIAAPLSVGLLSQILISPILKYAVNSSQTNSESIPRIPVNPSVFLFGSPIFILVLIALVLLFVSIKKFQFANDPLSKKAKVFLGVIFIFLFLPTIAIISFGFVKAMDKDYGYSNAKSQVTYHIYKPGILTKNLTNATKFVLGEELAGKQNAVRVVYDLPLEVMIKTGQSKPIVITQVGVESSFDLESFAAEYIKDASSKKIKLTTAANQTGYLLQKPLGKNTLSAVVYKTTDHVLLTLISPKASSFELIQLASSMR